MTAPTEDVLRTAVISDDGVYRYRLTRTWTLAAPDVWIMLNPSTADATKDDRTIGRCVDFSRSWGAGGITVVNLFALRATDPKELTRHPDPIGPGNPDAIRGAVQEAVNRGGRIIAAWGAHTMAVERARHVHARILRDVGDRVTALERTKSGAPKHPLYVRGDVYPTPWRPR